MEIIKRKLVISDIHGCYDEFDTLLGIVKYNSAKDDLMLLGDYVDRGKDSKKVVGFVRELTDTYGAVALRGNHDQMLLDWLKHPVTHFPHYYQNGGIHTIKNYIPDAERTIFAWDTYAKWADEIKTNHWEDVEFLSNLPYYHETEDFVFVHAGINPNLEDWKNTRKQDFIWIREPFLNHKHDLDKTVIHGHTPTVNLHKKPDIYFGDKKIGIDGACAYGYQLNCLEITEEGFKQYHVSKLN